MEVLVALLKSQTPNLERCKKGLRDVKTRETELSSIDY